jgi:hypothetical protein
MSAGAGICAEAAPAATSMAAATVVMMNVRMSLSLKMRREFTPRLLPGYCMIVAVPRTFARLRRLAGQASEPR